MRVDSVTVKGLRACVEADLRLPAYTVVRGVNGSGKSALLMGLGYCVTGRTYLTNRAGGAAAGMITWGLQAIETRVTLADGTAIERTINRDGKRTLSVNGVPAKQAEIWELLGVREHVVDALLDVEPFVSRSATEQQALLLRLFSGSAIVITAAMAAIGVTKLPTAQSIEPILKRLKDDDRRSVQREQRTLAAKGIKVPAWPFESRPEAYDKSFKAVVALLADASEAQTRIDATLEALNSQMVTADKADAPKAPSQSELNAAHLLVGKRREECQAAEVAALTLVQEATPRLEEQRKLLTLVGEINSSLARVDGELKGIGSPVECSAADCPVIAAFKAEAAERIAKLERVKSELAKRFSAVVEERAPIDHELNEMNKRKRALDSAKLGATRAAHKAKGDLDILEAAKAAGEAFEQAKLALTNVNEQRERLLLEAMENREKLKTLKARHTKAVQMMERITAHNNEVAACTERAERYHELGMKATALNQAIADLDRARKKQLDEGSGEALALINEFVGGFGMEEVTYDQATGFMVGDTPLAAESQGRGMLLFDAALRFAAARASGLHFMVLDHTAPITPGLAALMAKKLEASGVQVVQTFTSQQPGEASSGQRLNVVMRDGKAEVIG